MQWLTATNIKLLYRELEAAQAEDADGRDDVLAGFACEPHAGAWQIDRVVAAIADLGHSQALIEKLAQLEKQAAAFAAQIATEEAKHSPAPPL